jgi:hypothetical protein
VGAHCVERIPQGASRPTLVEKIEGRAKAGELVELSVMVEHAAGETATFSADLPALLGTVDKGAKLADEAAFGRGAPPKPQIDAANPQRAHTLLKVPLVFLSTSLQRTPMTVPALRVVVLRKGGGDLDVCTKPHVVEIDQPTANTPDPQVRPNPASVPQITRNERLQEIASWLGIGLLVGLAIAALVSWARRRPKVVPPPPPPPPPWRTAMEAIEAARLEYDAGKLATKPYYDRLSDAVRAYLGKLFAFDGLELTTDEILAKLRKVPSPTLPFGDVSNFLGDCDLVKFAGLTVPREEGLAAAEAARKIVRALSPHGTGTSWMHAYAGTREDERDDERGGAASGGEKSGEVKGGEPRGDGPPTTGGEP